MSRRLYLLLIAVLAGGVIAVGCGDDDDDNGGGSDEPAQTQTDTGGTDTEDTGGTGDVSADVEQAVEDCKEAVTATPNLSADVKSDLEGICEDAASGDEEAVAEATKEVCVKIIEDTVPAGPARDAGVDACNQADTTP